ncbi:MAG: hypothetical protein ACRC30_15930 [Clostridium sp.]
MNIIYFKEAKFVINAKKYILDEIDMSKKYEIVNLREVKNGKKITLY